MPDDPRKTPEHASATQGELPLDRAALLAWRERERLGFALAMSELVSMLAHDLNQPLAAIVTNAIAAKRWLATSPAELREASSAAVRIAREGNRASQMIERVRDQLKRNELQLEALSLPELLHELTPAVHEELSLARATLDLQLSPALPRVLCDRTRLEQVLLNLVRNALEALARVETERRVIELGAVAHGKAEVDVFVRDRGPGLASDRDLAFQPFYSTKSQGLGLGLNVSRSLVRSFGGRLWAVANAGGGETFHFTLPVASERS